MAFSWGNPLNWFRSYRHLSAYIWDNTDKKRKEWVRAQRERHGDDFLVDRTDLGKFSFLLLADTGEGDQSQLVLVDKLLKEGKSTEFAIIGSDVVYPAGRSHHYLANFYMPYRNYLKDIYAVPGNHDWYDVLTGFMIHFCDNQFHRRKRSKRTVDESKLRDMRAIRRNEIYQPNMYFCLDTASLRIVCVDTGIRTHIDDEQMAWLRRVSETDKRKILITGDPIYANGRYEKRLAELDEIVRNYGYLAVIGGDTHNYQQYRVTLTAAGSKRDVWYFVNGGGGAFLSRTDHIPEPSAMKVPDDVRVSDFDLYPDREASREFFDSGNMSFLPDVIKWRMPAALLNKDRPPYYKSFMKVVVRKTFIEFQVFRIENFGQPWLDAGPWKRIRIE